MSNNLTIPIPDLRYENTFRKSLRSYAQSSKTNKTKKTKKHGNALNINEEQSHPEPVAPITPGIVIYAIIKDQIVMQFAQGFGLAVLFMLAAPYFRYLVRSGRSWGEYVKTKVLGVAGSYGVGGARHSWNNVGYKY